MGGGHSHEFHPDVSDHARRAAEEKRRREKAETAARQAEEAARLAREIAEQIARELEAQRARELEARLEAERIAQAMREEEERMWRQRVAAEARAAAERQAAEEREREERERREMAAHQAEEERQRRIEAEEVARRAREAQEAEAARQARIREEEARRAREAAEEAQRAARAAEEAARRAREEQEAAEEVLRSGAQPVVVPTAEEVRAAKDRVAYRAGMCHVAIAGVAGSGKSSLVNALCGMTNADASAAPTGVNETTLEVNRYVNPTHGEQVAWYDVPGAGTLKIPDWQYFNAQGLFVFDCIVVLFNNRFTMTDQAIIANCKRFKIPTFIVRSKSDQHIFNLMKEMGYDPDEEEGDREQLYKVAREQYIAETRETVRKNLVEANLPDQRVYVVSNKTLLGIVQEQTAKKVIDEVELLTHLYSEARPR